jgi:hypothetical protein
MTTMTTSSSSIIIIMVIMIIVSHHLQRITPRDPIPPHPVCPAGHPGHGHSRPGAHASASVGPAQIGHRTLHLGRRGNEAATRNEGET